MLDQLVGTLRRLRNSLSRKAEQAYKNRDAAEGSTKEAYADGEAHAYGDASDEVRKAEKEEE